MRKENQKETPLEPTVSEVKEPSIIISMDEVYKDYDNYTNSRVLPLENILNVTDNRSVWFSVNELKNYLDKVEKVATEKNIPLTGVNMIFAAYDNDVQLGENKNKQTLFLAPTVTDKTLNYPKSFSINNGQFFAIEQIKDMITLDNSIAAATNESLLLSPEGTISNATAINMFNNYYTTRVKNIPQVDGFDTKAVWYSIEQWREYIAYVEQETSKIGQTVSGFQLVFSSYEDNKALGIQANKQTIFLTPTTATLGAKGTTANRPFYIKGNDLEFMDFVKGKTNSKLANKKRIQSLSANHGQITPPPCTENCHD